MLTHTHPTPWLKQTTSIQLGHLRRLLQLIGSSALLVTIVGTATRCAGVFTLIPSPCLPKPCRNHPKALTTFFFPRYSARNRAVAVDSSHLGQIPSTRAWMTQSAATCLTQRNLHWLKLHSQLTVSQSTSLLRKS